MPVEVVYPILLMLLINYVQLWADRFQYCSNKLDKMAWSCQPDLQPNACKNAVTRKLYLLDCLRSCPCARCLAATCSTIAAATAATTIFTCHPSSYGKFCLDAVLFLVEFTVQHLLFFHKLLCELPDQAGLPTRPLFGFCNSLTLESSTTRVLQFVQPLGWLQVPLFEKNLGNQSIQHQRTYTHIPVHEQGRQEQFLLLQDGRSSGIANQRILRLAHKTLSHHEMM